MEKMLASSFPARSARRELRLNGSGAIAEQLLNKLGREAVDLFGPLLSQPERDREREVFLNAAEHRGGERLF